MARNTDTGRRRALRALPTLLAACAVLALPAGAAAHAVVQPGASRPADLQRYTVTIPNEGGSPTTEVALKVPTGVDFLLAERQAGWKVSNQAQDASHTLRWSGGTIPPNFYATFHFIARNPVKAGPIEWKIIQTYADGKAQRWIGPPDSEEPAARTEISETAPQQDVVAVNGGNASAQASPGPATDAGSQDGDDDDGSDVLLIALAGAALVAAVAALIVALRGRPRPA
jgi:uncharacterized protein YcnI